MACVLIMGGLTVFSVYFYHTEEWTERNQQILKAAQPRDPQMPTAMDSGGRFQHGA